MSRILLVHWNRDEAKERALMGVMPVNAVHCDSALRSGQVYKALYLL